jgi:hypothetical protein
MSRSVAVVAMKSSSLPAALVEVEEEGEQADFFDTPSLKNSGIQGQSSCPQK